MKLETESVRTMLLTRSRLNRGCMSTLARVALLEKESQKEDGVMLLMPSSSNVDMHFLAGSVWTSSSECS